MAQYERALVLSTANISQETCNVFLASNEGPVFAKGEYGYFVYAHLEDPDMPTDLEAALQLAQNDRCDWVMFDRDGEIDDRLPTFDWESAACGVGSGAGVSKLLPAPVSTEEEGR